LHSLNRAVEFDLKWVGEKVEFFTTVHRQYVSFTQWSCSRPRQQRNDSIG
jgi:hypothetical protein